MWQIVIIIGAPHQNFWVGQIPPSTSPPPFTFFPLSPLSPSPPIPFLPFDGGPLNTAREYRGALYVPSAGNFTNFLAIIEHTGSGAATGGGRQGARAPTETSPQNFYRL